MAKFSLRVYTSRLLPMGVQDFMGKSEYVRSSDFRRTEANFRRKNAQASAGQSHCLKSLSLAENSVRSHV